MNDPATRGPLTTWYPATLRANSGQLIVLVIPGEATAPSHKVIGYGPHLCHWCGKAVHWRSTLHVDHLDGYGDNNVPDNLVPSCNRCNSGRASRARAEAYRDAGFWSAHDTQKRTA